MKSTILPLSLIAITGLFVSSCEKRQHGSNQSEAPPAITELYDSPTQPKEDPTWPPVAEESVDNVMLENYLVVLDDSGSMKGERISQAKQALQELAQSLPQQHNLGLIYLNNKQIIPLGTNNRQSFIQNVINSNAQGKTPLTAATKRAFSTLTEQASKQKGYGNYHLIIVTDGKSSDGTPSSIVKSIVLNSAIQVHIIGFHLKDHELNLKRFVDYHTAGNANELAAAFEAVAAETDTFSDPKDFSN